jgi:serine phosphatase RsbU (regulator of sigma subunit)
MTSAPRARRRRLVDWGVAAHTKAGETTSGDRYVVAPFREGLLVGAVDGLGHGREAAAAAARATRVLEREPEVPLPELVRRCHDALIDTRGVVLSLATISAPLRTLTWIGVGNVEGLVLRSDPAASPASEALLLRGGVVGYQLPQLSVAVLAVSPGDVVVFATDGVRPDFPAGARAGESPQHLAERLLRVYGRETDDALVLAVEILGSGS